jgi:hypothetical protein
MSSNPRSFMDSNNPNSARADPNNPNAGNPNDSGLRTLLNANNLDSYVLPSALSVTVARAHKQSYATATSFGLGNANTVSMVLTPGSDYVYGPDSFITFKLTCANTFSSTANIINLAVGATDMYTPHAVGAIAVTPSHQDKHIGTWGKHGTVCNLFKSIRLTHASGTELEYIDNLNVLNTIKTQYDRDASWRQTKGSAMGGKYMDSKIDKIWTNQASGNDGENWRAAVLAAADHDAEARGNDDLRYPRTIRQWTQEVVAEGGVASKETFYAVPLSILSEFFNSDKLLPPYVLAGMRIELELESPYLAISLQKYSDGLAVPVVESTAAGATTINSGTCTFLLSDVRVQLDSHTLTDSVQKALAQMSANEGLDLHFSSWFHDRHKMTSNATTFNITKALSRVEDITIVPRTDAEFTDNSALTYSYDSLAAKPTFTCSSWQISIGSMFFPSHPVTDKHASYMLAQQGRSEKNEIDYNTYANGGLGIVRGALERSQILNGSGIAISATRGATVAYEDQSVDRPTLELFVKHTRLASVFLDNIVVRT